MHDVHAKKVTSKTHFSPRPQFQSASPEFISGCRYDKNVAKKSSWGGHFQAVLFGGASAKSDDLGTYFMPFGSPSAKVSEVTIDPLVSDPSQTLHAQNFNILTQRASGSGLVGMRDEINLNTENTFKSTISLHPREWSVGLGLSYQHLFNKKSNHPWWLSISTPILHVENDVRVQEVITNDGGGVIIPNPANTQPLFGTMKDALHQDAWLYGKIDNHAHHKTGFGDIETKLGFIVAQTESIVFDLSLGFIIPTSNKQKNHFMFEPQLGNGQHVGLLGGGTFSVILCEDDAAHWSFSYEAAVNAQYLFENTQKRSFDLINKPWSRYLEMYASKAQADLADIAAGPANGLISTPGINILTQDMKVEPGFNVTWNNAFVLNCSSWEFEAGYNLHARESESVKLKNQWVESAAIKAANGDGRINPSRDITANKSLHVIGNIKSPMFYDQFKIKATDLDLNSAAHPSVVSHTVYGAAGYRWTTCKWPFGVTYGGSYEFPSDGNKSLSRWTMWLKADISF